MPSSVISSETPRVLLVDDNEPVLRRAAALLTPGFEIVAAVTDGGAALEAADRLSPDVIVLDISMPGMCGLDVAASLRARGFRGAVVFLTVHDEEDIVQAAQAAGGIGYVVKRRLVSDLAAAVREARAGRPFVSRVS